MRAISETAVLRAKTISTTEEIILHESERHPVATLGPAARYIGSPVANRKLEDTSSGEVATCRNSAQSIRSNIPPNAF